MSARLSVLLALAAALALPATAQGFTASKVTAPADGFYSVAGAGGTLDIRATLTGAVPTDKADLVCIVLRNSFRVLFDAADASGGIVEKTIDLADLRSGTCLILAVPDGTDVATADLTQFTGPIITTDWRETYRTPPDDASGDVPYDFLFAQQQARGYGDYDGISRLRRVRHEPALRRHAARERVHVLRERVPRPRRARAADAVAPAHRRPQRVRLLRGAARPRPERRLPGRVRRSRASRRSRRRRPAGAARTS